jgi:hypothetical protein
MPRRPVRQAARKVEPHVDDRDPGPITRNASRQKRNGALQADVDDFIEHRVVGLIDRRPFSRAGVVHQAVEPPEDAWRLQPRARACPFVVTSAARISGPGRSPTTPASCSSDPSFARPPRCHSTPAAKRRTVVTRFRNLAPVISATGLCEELPMEPVPPFIARQCYTHAMEAGEMPLRRVRNCRSRHFIVPVQIIGPAEMLYSSGILLDKSGPAPDLSDPARSREALVQQGRRAGPALECAPEARLFE